MHQVHCLALGLNRHPTLSPNPIVYALGASIFSVDQFDGGCSQALPLPVPIIAAVGEPAPPTDTMFEKPWYRGERAAQSAKQLSYFMQPTTQVGKNNRGQVRKNSRLNERDLR
jgi:hypothetical protein